MVGAGINGPEVVGSNPNGANGSIGVACLSKMLNLTLMPEVDGCASTQEFFVYAKQAVIKVRLLGRQRRAAGPDLPFFILPMGHWFFHPTFVNILVIPDSFVYS